VRYADTIQGRVVEDDPFGPRIFLSGFARAFGERTRKERRLSNHRGCVENRGATTAATTVSHEEESTGKTSTCKLFISHWRPNAGLGNVEESIFGWNAAINWTPGGPPS